MIYDFECPKCKAEKTVIRRLKDWRKGLRCPSCGARMTRHVSLFTAKVWPPKGIPKSHVRPNGGLWMEHMGPQGKVFYSEKSLRNYCRKEGFETEALL